MRRYQVGIGGATYVIEVDEVSAEKFQVTVGGQEFTVTLSAAEDVAETVIAPDFRGPSANGHVFPDGPSGPIPSPARFKPAPPETLASMVPAAPPPLPHPPDRAARDTGPFVKAPMPGKITSVDVQPGSEVRAGDLLLKLEAMKMVNAIKSPRSGVIDTVAVQAGQSVGYGQVLVAFREQ